MLTIDRVTKDDLTDLAFLYEELSGEKTDQQKLKESFSHIDANSDYLLAAAREDGRHLVGSLMAIVCHDMVGDCRPFMVLENVIVKSERRGLGVGKRLMRYIEDYARQRGCSYIIFVSGAQRKQAHAFYASLGYALDAARGFKKHL